MANPRQMFDHWLEAPKGWPSLDAVDFRAKLSANVTIDPVFKGRVVHVNEDGEFEMGISGTQMAIFLLQNSDDPDVQNAGGDHWTPISPQVWMSGLVAVGAYELESSEFDSAQTYVPNETLTAVADNANATLGGRLTNQNATAYTDAVCGVVSREPYKNVNGIMMLPFWPVYLPATPV